VSRLARGGALRRRPAAVFATLAVAFAGCGGSSDQKPRFTTESIRSGFVKPADVGQGAVEFEDEGHGTHVNFTPEGTVPTCPYVQRADDTQGVIEAAVELEAGNPTGRFIVAPSDPRNNPLPIVTQGALVFASETLAATAMERVTAAAGKCPSTFTILGGPPVIIGSYTVNARPFEIDGWKGYSQQLAHTAPDDINPETYDDLVTVVVQKANAIVYAGFEQTKKVGERADSSAKAQETLGRALARLG
jgi:hypothetical protein